MKKEYVIFFMILTLSMQQAVCDQNGQKKSDEIKSKGIDELTTILDSETPMQMNVRTIRPILNQATLQSDNRLIQGESKTSLFNKTFVKFIKEVYNENEYIDVISQNAEHIVQFLELATEFSLDIDNVYVCMRLFYNKIKGCEAIDDSMLNHVMPHFKRHLSRFFKNTNDDKIIFNVEFLKKNIDNIIINSITNGLPEFKKEENQINPITKNLFTLIENEALRTTNEITKYEQRTRLRGLIIKFFEVVLQKIIWNPRSPEGIWTSFLSIAHNLQLFGRHEIIDHMDDLDDLLWSLIHRFCFFIDLVGVTLPLNFYQEVESDILNKVVFFLETPEQDYDIKTKKEVLAMSLFRSKTKALALEQKGIIA